MEYNLDDVFGRISEIVDVVYLTDSEADTYTALKDNSLFRNVFGLSGSYRDMISHCSLQWIQDL